MKTEDVIKAFNIEPLRCWEEDFSHENGNYSNHCYKCGMEFIGHKRRVMCKMCYNDALEPTTEH